MALDPRLSPTDYAGDFDVQEAELQRQRQLLQAMALRDQGTQSQMVSGHYIPSGWLGALADVASQGIRASGQGHLAAQESELNKARDAAFLTQMAKQPTGTPGRAATPGLSMEGVVQDMPSEAVAAKEPTREEMLRWALGFRGLGQMGNKMAETAMSRLTTQPKMELKEVIDPSSGRKTHVAVDINALQPGQQIGGVEAPNLQFHMGVGEGSNTHQAYVFNPGTGKSSKFGPESTTVPTDAMMIEYLMKNNGVPRDEATSLTLGWRKYLQTPTNIVPTNILDLYKSGGGGAAPGAAPPAGQGSTPAPGVRAPAGASVSAAPAGETLTGIYAPKGGPSGSISLDPNNLGGQERLAKDVELYGKRLQDTHLPAAENALSRVETIIAKFPKGDIPGVGYLGNRPVASVFRDDAQDVQSAIQIFKALKLRADAGLSQTNPELANVLKSMGVGDFQSEKTFRTAMGRLREAVDIDLNTIHKSFDPQVRKRYEDNSRKGSESSESEMDRMRRLAGGG